ncbi:MAG TPA: thioredoxin domain-containing protein [Chitinophagaceae bacterium]|jgi:protein-disulfide isomerase
MSLRVPVSDNDHSQGEKNAAIVLIEYGDYECPHCGAAYPVIKKLQKHFGGKLRFIFRNFPIAESHPHAVTAAYVAEASALQDKFWPVHDLIYEHQQNLSTKLLLSLAESAGVDIKQLSQDISTPAVTDRVEKDLEGGARSGVNGTPSFFVNGYKYEGYHEYDRMRKDLESIL